MPQRQKVSIEEKVKNVQAYLSGEISISEAVRRSGLARSKVEEWARNYQAEGVAVFLPHRNRVYSPELKTQAVREYLSGSGSMSDICKKYHIRSEKQLYNWLKVYNAHGDFNFTKFSGGGSCMRQGRKTTQEERIRIAKECIGSGKNYGEVALKYQVSYQQVRKWTLRFEEAGETGLEDRRGHRKKDQTPRTELEQAQIEIEQLKHRLYLAEMERDLLKKLNEVERRDASQN